MTVEVPEGGTLVLDDIDLLPDGTADAGSEGIEVKGTLTSVDCTTVPPTLVVTTPTETFTASFDPATTRITVDDTGAVITTCADLGAETGLPVELEAHRLADGSLVADRLDIDPQTEFKVGEVEVKGVVTAAACPDSLTVTRADGTDIVVNLSATTVIKSEQNDVETLISCADVALGASVEVKGTPGPGGSVNATEVDVKQDKFEADGTIDSASCATDPQTLSFTPDGSAAPVLVILGPTVEIEVNDSDAACTDLSPGPGKVEGVIQADGSVAATEVKQGSGDSGDGGGDGGGGDGGGDDGGDD